MRQSEKNLLGQLRGRRAVNSEEPLKNVKNSIGSLQYASADPSSKTEISLHISLRYYNVALGIEVLPAALFAAGQVPIPVFLFGLTDFWGGYNNMIDQLPLQGAWARARYSVMGLPYVGIYGVSTGLVGGAPAALEATVDYGDMLQQYMIFPVFGMVRIHCNNIAYGTFLNNFSSDIIYIEKIRFIVPLANINQLDNPFKLSHQSTFGITATDSIDPKMFTLPSQPQNQIVDIPINMPIDKNIMLGYYQNFDCTDIDMILFIKKVAKLSK